MSETVNARTNGILSELKDEFPSGDTAFLLRVAVTVSYCYAVASIECRHRIWPYNMLDLSRRTGELWQGSCLTAWTYRAVTDVEMLETPKFSEVRTEMLSSLWDLFHDHPNVALGVEMVDTFTHRMDCISMVSDVMFLKDGIPHIIDFKFRFMSNEKGNKDRIEELGWAYRKWDDQTDLGILVCHPVNNNYLNKLADSDWGVITGRDAYKRIGELTGTPFVDLLDQCVDFRNDLPAPFVKYVDEHSDNLRCFLDWHTDTSRVSRRD